MNNNLKPIGRFCHTIGALPTSYLISLSYEEQLIYLCNKMDEITNFINNDIDQKLKDYIDERFNEILLDTMYDSQTETLIMYINRGDE